MAGRAEEARRQVAERVWELRVEANLSRPRLLALATNALDWYDRQTRVSDIHLPTWAPQ